MPTLPCRLLTCLLLLAAPGCISSGNSPSESLLYAVRDFNTELRWGRYDQIAPYLRPEVRDRYLEQLQSLGEDVEVVDQELTQIALTGPEQATARVQWSWTSKKRGLLERTSLKQHWGLARGRWVLLRQERMAGPPLKPLEDPTAQATDGGAPRRDGGVG